MKTKNNPRRAGAATSRRAAAPRKMNSKSSARSSKIQREAEARSRGDSPQATKASERSPRTENL